MAPNRWLHVRHPDGFSAAQFDRFRASCRVFRAYVETALTEWVALEGDAGPRYEFYEPELSADRTVATLPLGGAGTLKTRHDFEDLRSVMLWEWFPASFIAKIEEGITESVTGTRTTTWRKPALRIPGWHRARDPANV